jgi:RNA polymerase sigma-70 factor (ECF subfamily)
MIRITPTGHFPIGSMTARELDTHTPPVAAPVGDAMSPERRLRELIDLHYDFVWRTVRYLRVPDSSLEDAAQQVLCILARRLQDVVPGAEKSFLYGTAVRVAKDLRRTAQRRPATPDPDLDAFVATDPGPEDLLARRRQHAELQRLLDALPDDLRMVFVLYEIEELTMAEIAQALEMSPGTVASRLRKARETFERLVARRRASERRNHGGGHE